MWYEVFKFEIKYRLKRPETYIFFLFLLLFSIVGVDFVFQGVDLGGVKKNAPITIAKTMGAISGIFMILASMIMGVPILRDFQYNIESLMFVNPIKKKDYLLGRFLGSFTILLFVFSAVLFGMIMGEFMPWHDPEKVLAFNLLTYVKPFVSVVLPILFFGGTLFFVSGMLSKKLVVVYTQGILFFVVFMLTKAIENDYLQAFFDPFSLTTLSLLTKTWTVAELNAQSIPFLGILLYNKLFWFLFGIVILIFGYRKFNFNILQTKKYKTKKIQISEAKPNDIYESKHPNFKIQDGISLKRKQLWQMSWFYFTNICKQPSFWAIVISGMVIILINSVSLGTVYGVNSFPATYFIVEELQETSLYFFIIVLVFYSGELIWKERGAKLNLIYDATPVSDLIHLASKYIGLTFIYVVLMISLIISGIAFQTINGYYNYELEVYFYGFFLEVLPFLMLYTFIAFFMQVLTNNKFVGIILVLVFFISNIALGLFGYEHDLYLFGGNSLGTYSDMNGYGHFLKPYLWIKAYWFLFGLILLIIASTISVRGTETSLVKRFKAIRYRLNTSHIRLSILVVVSFVLVGGYIFYNTNVLNKYWTSSEAFTFRIGYEKALKRYEYISQPKITDVNVQVELYPSTRDYSVEGYYVLKNMHNEAITEVHIQKQIESQVLLDSVAFEGGAEKNDKYKMYDYSIYTLANVLQPGDSVKMYFHQRFITEGFEEGNSSTRIVNNGIFMSGDHFPTIGYNKKYELQDKDDRKEHHLPERVEKAHREDVVELQNARSGSDSNGIRFEMIIGTDQDQTAIAPGNLLKEWKEKSRNYFHYKMDQQMINFYAIVSGKYEVKRAIWKSKEDPSSKPIDLEIYYHPGHAHNLDRMMKSMKASFDYFSKIFSPYQYGQMRIMEFPRYAQFAQSFPGTVPFSESMGFVLDIDDEKDVDMVFYITAHELAHQWWGMQVEAANVQGRNFILETLAQYSALMVLKQQYSKEKVQQFLDIQMESYTKGKRKEKGNEPSLALVENQEYIYYAKGAINMYALQKHIGEGNVNIALQRFIKDWNTIDGKLKIHKDRYATSKDLLVYFRQVTPHHLQDVITELFESVVDLQTK